MIAAFIQIIRWKNLLLLAMVQLLVFFKLLDHASSVLDTPDLIFLITITALIGASGYIINDYYDAEIDKVNKPLTAIAGRVWPLRTVLNVYFAFVTLGFILSIWLSLRLDLLPYIILYLFAVAGLWYYSFSLKCKPLSGNLMVSLFCASVVAVVALPDLLHENGLIIRTEFSFYIAFAFLATWYREVVKDIEDIDGDQKAGCQTFPVKFGIKPSKVMALVPGAMLLASLILWDNMPLDNRVHIGLVILQGFVVASMGFVWWSNTRVYHTYASAIIKFVMAGGTLLLLLL